MVPGGPELGCSLVMPGVTVKFHALLVTPPTITAILAFPVSVPYGTTTVMLVALQFVGQIPISLNVTELSSRVAPKLVPVMVRLVPTGPMAGDTLVMRGAVVRMLYTDVATLLFVKPLAYATALRVVVALTVTGPMYSVPTVSLGVLPSKV